MRPRAQVGECDTRHTMERDLASWLAKPWPDMCWADYAATSHPNVPQRKVGERGRQGTQIRCDRGEVARPQARSNAAESSGSQSATSRVTVRAERLAFGTQLSSRSEVVTGECTVLYRVYVGAARPEHVVIHILVNIVPPSSLPQLGRPRSTWSVDRCFKRVPSRTGGFGRLLQYILRPIQYCSQPGTGSGACGARRNLYVAACINIIERNDI